MYRMAHVFLSLDQIGQAQQVAAATSELLNRSQKASKPRQKRCRYAVPAILCSPSPQRAITTAPVCLPAHGHRPPDCRKSRRWPRRLQH
jgi:hypothetical protein